MKPHYLLVGLLLLAGLCSATWSPANIEDFANQAYAHSGCGKEPVNISQVLAEENQTVPSFAVLQFYENRSNCDGLVRGVWHWLSLNPPKGACPEDFDRQVHLWVSSGFWNWQWATCGLNFSKSDWDQMVSSYSKAFFEKNLVYAEPQMQYTYNWTKWQADQTPQQNSGIMGGGGLQIPGKNVVFSSVFGLPLLLIILEIFLLWISYQIGKLFWRSSDWQQGMQRHMDSPFKNFGMGLSKKMKLLFMVFIIMNILWWVAFFLFL